ncbi:peptidase C15 [Cyanobacteria bacterium FACHB-DQ100]|uniref:pyroglutamyl-peptidase I family protein n=1 Tax=Leptolyngbya sp. DQ-M1 TaxID=2933920 RepID=UPI0019A3C8D6|nr:peptidase C15 [Cyanobacteria bacterium FACHB-DQ100]
MKILLTSFTTWMEHQRSNASDDLIQAILDRERFHPNCHFLRQLPVDFELAPKQTIAKINEIQPDVTICCGMAESRQCLSLESNGKFQSEILRSRLDLKHLMESTIATEISHDAGNFVCNYLYYCVLKHLESLNRHCIFIHVPVLTTENTEIIVQDFLNILDRICIQ